MSEQETPKVNTTDDTTQIMEGAGVSFDEYIAMSNELRDLRSSTVMQTAIGDVMRVAVAFGVKDQNDMNDLYGRLQTCVHFGMLMQYAVQRNKTIEDYSLGGVSEEWLVKIQQQMNNDVANSGDPNATIRPGLIRVPSSDEPSDDELTIFPDPEDCTEEEFVDRVSQVAAAQLGVDISALPPAMRDELQNKISGIYREKIQRA